MGDEYEVRVSLEVRDLLDSLDDKSARIVRDNLSKLKHPYPGDGQGDKEKITWRGEEVYRLHIGRTWTAFYDIHDDEVVVKVLKVMPIDDAHKSYGQMD